ncbi:uncharacterized protein SAPINGB_P000044 [Magnusiomyces paraingens]|uniref:Uncharacterized protein n=1 Tax=Magnusiomyces paraingens TaxID=2606893 RepID=A0A5E8AX10_9ASCO|nr:uncharacterized protein SAPINGB_P000044 [Saprochaete ingens]VVT43567.1 unnamed protein product [Saprochaete ingens]
MLSQSINPFIPIKLTNSVTLLIVNPALYGVFSGNQVQEKAESDGEQQELQSFGPIKETNVVFLPLFWWNPFTLKVEMIKQKPQQQQTEAEQKSNQEAVQEPASTNVVKATVINIPLCVVA